MVHVGVSLRGKQDPHIGKMNYPMVNLYTAAADLGVLSLWASTRHVSLPLKKSEVTIIWWIGMFKS